MKRLYSAVIIASIIVVVVSILVLSNVSEIQNSTGILEGTVDYIGLICVPEQRDIPPCSGPYPNYEIIVYTSDGNTVVKKTITDDNGNYQFNLDFGTYVIYEPKLQNNKPIDIPTTIQVDSSSITHNVIIDSGIR